MVSRYQLAVLLITQRIIGTNALSILPDIVTANFKPLVASVSDVIANATDDLIDPNITIDDPLLFLNSTIDFLDDNTTAWNGSFVDPISIWTTLDDGNFTIDNNTLLDLNWTIPYYPLKYDPNATYDDSSNGTVGIPFPWYRYGGMGGNDNETSSFNITAIPYVLYDKINTTFYPVALPLSPPPIDTTAIDKTTIEKPEITGQTKNETKVRTPFYIENNGLVVMEAEKITSLPKGWEFVTVSNNRFVGNFTGEGYLQYNASDKSIASSSKLRYRFRINNPGTYNLIIRTNSDDSTSTNLSIKYYTKLPLPNNISDPSIQTITGTNRKKYGWTFETKHGPKESFNSTEQLVNATYTFPVRRIYTLEILGVTKGFAIDRIVLYDLTKIKPFQAKRLTNPESPTSTIGGNNKDDKDDSRGEPKEHDNRPHRVPSKKPRTKPIAKPTAVHTPRITKPAK
jgi:hypothetical protein